MSELTFEIYTDNAGEKRWRLKHRNGHTMADSGQGYSRKEDCVRAIATIREHVLNSEVVELD